MSEAVVDTCSAVLEFLDGQAPAESLQEMRGMTLPDDAETLLERAEELSLCLAYIDHKGLAAKLLAAYIVLCKETERDRKKAWKKWWPHKEEVVKFEKVDVVKDPEELEKMKVARDDLDAKGKRVSGKFYKYRAVAGEADVRQKFGIPDLDNEIDGSAEAERREKRAKRISEHPEEMVKIEQAKAEIAKEEPGGWQCGICKRSNPTASNKCKICNAMHGRGN